MSEGGAPRFPTAVFTDSHRSATEDRAAALPLRPDAVLLAVADGVGGRRGGALAADMAIRMVTEAAPGIRAEDEQEWRRLVARVDAALSEDGEAGETTLVLAAVTPRRLVGASAGDSEAWFITPEGHYDLTGGQERKPYVGSGAARVIPFTLPLPGAGTLLAATDGLFKYAPDERIGDVTLLPDLEEAARRLADLPRLNSGRLPDDFAAALCRVPAGAATGMAGRVAARLQRMLPLRRLSRIGNNSGTNTPENPSEYRRGVAIRHTLNIVCGR